VQVDKTWCHDQVVCSDLEGRTARKTRRDCSDAIAFDCDIGAIPGISGSVDDPAPADDEIEDRLCGCSADRADVRTSNGKRLKVRMWT